MSHAIHTLCGILIFFFTLAYAFKALSDIGWEIKTITAHTVFGLFMLACVFLLVFFGMVASCFSLYARPNRWSAKMETQVLFGKIHAFLARRILVVGFITTSLGLAQYQLNFNEDNYEWAYLISHVTVVIIIATTFEILF